MPLHYPGTYKAGAWVRAPGGSTIPPLPPPPERVQGGGGFFCVRPVLASCTTLLHSDSTLRHPQRKISPLHLHPFGWGRRGRVVTSSGARTRALAVCVPGMWALVVRVARVTRLARRARGVAQVAQVAGSTTCCTTRARAPGRAPGREPGREPGRAPGPARQHSCRLLSRHRLRRLAARPRPPHHSPPPQIPRRLPLTVSPGAGRAGRRRRWPPRPGDGASSLLRCGGRGREGAVSVVRVGGGEGRRRASLWSCLFVPPSGLGLTTAAEAGLARGLRLSSPRAFLRNV